MLQTLNKQKSNYIKLKKTDRGKQSFSKLTGSGSGQISARIRPDPDPSIKWPDLGSGRSLHILFT